MLIESYNEVSDYVIIKLGYMSIFKGLMTIKEQNI